MHLVYEVDGFIGEYKELSSNLHNNFKGDAEFFG
jgi:hypothetical protein